ELDLLGASYVDFMSPVHFELRLRNGSARSLCVDARLQPQDGRVTVMVRHPSGRVSSSLPLTCRLRAAAMRELEGTGAADRPGADRYSEEVDITYGRRGFQFAEPGDYLIWVTYRGLDRGTILSNTLRLRVGRPESSELERLA